ncbi:GNAT family N-acetyltransferase [Pleionea sediminis]|uniref:GNAT family N-acetyltransferase n=1 Tax=Pleionea sediminis TaxID=2569479 RepID=UPI0011868784|nr:GNAT family N-acetyltransferase [Pleionea sediminis]
MSQQLSFEKLVESKIIREQQDLVARRHRLALLCFEDDNLTSFLESNTVKLVNFLKDQGSSQKVLCVTEFDMPCFEILSPKRYQKALGQEWDIIVLDITKGISASVIASLSGALKAGGLLFIVGRSQQSWLNQNNEESYRLFGDYPAYQSRFFERLIHLSPEKRGLIDWNRSHIELPDHQSEILNQAEAPIYKEQDIAIKKIIQVFTGHPKRPLIITADRGRGKSSALGIAAAQLVNERQKRLVVVAMHQGSIEPVMNWFHKLVKPEHRHLLTFMPPDELLISLKKKCLDIDGVLVDEAAVIPSNILFQISNSINRIVFSTTIHGYEGSGRGFNIRFKSKLLELMPQTKEYQLTQAIRWNEGDPLEMWTFDTLILKYQVNLISYEESNLKWIWVKEGEAIPEEYIETSFGLLVDSHYQTTPDDLRQFLDHPARQLLVAVSVSENKVDVLGVCLILTEGGNSEKITTDIIKGKRRLRGQLVAQTLARYSGCSKWSSDLSWRVQRIAVAASCRDKGIGSQIIRRIEQQASVSNISFLSTSFAATDDLIPFWRSLDFIPVKLGYSYDKSSGAHSLIMLKLVNHFCNRDEITERFYSHTHQLLASVFKNLSTLVVIELLTGIHQKIGLYIDNNRIYRFINGEIQLFDATLELSDLIHFSLYDGNFDQEERYAVEGLIAKLWQNCSSNEWCESFNASGKKEEERMLREFARRLIKKVQSSE